MSLQLTVPAKQSRPDAKIYYVTSESHPEKDHHIVVRKENYFFCDCRDFMIRKLPGLNSTTAERCKHGDFCHDAELRVPAGHELYKATRETIKSRVKPVKPTPKTDRLPGCGGA